MIHFLKILINFFSVVIRFYFFGYLKILTNIPHIGPLSLMCLAPPSPAPRNQLPPHQISVMDFPFPVSCINCNEKQLECKASSHSKGSCHHCLLNGIECFFPVFFSCGSGGGGVSNGLPRCWCIFIPAQLFSLHPKPQTMPAQQPLPVTMLTLHQARASHIISIIVTRMT